VPYSKVCRYRPRENDLLVEAGYGWKPGVVGNVVSRADASSPQGRAFSTGQPSISRDLRKEQEFVLPAFYAEHGIISAVDVVIKGTDEPYGVLEIDNDRQCDYDEHDINFLTGFANVLAEAVATSERTATLRSTITQMVTAVEEKDRLLDQKKMLAEELQHRVRNNLQLIKAIVRRVSTLAQVYDHLLGREMSRTTDFGGYLKSLCANLLEIQDSPSGAVTLTCTSDTIFLDLNSVTALGLIVTELLANSFDHAFPDGVGKIAVTVRAAGDHSEMATLIVRDDGPGFIMKSESKRHGLGLVRRLAEQLGGTTEVENDHGTLWTIRFPALPAGALA
jgi:two-component sensor histidine kinase